YYFTATLSSYVSTLSLHDALPIFFRVLQERSSRYCEDDVDGDERGDTERHTRCNDHLVLLYPSRIRLRSTGIWIAFDPSGNARPDLFLTTETFMTSPDR